jgi:hypothetical protein
VWALHLVLPGRVRLLTAPPARRKTVTAGCVNLPAEAVALLERERPTRLLIVE